MNGVASPSNITACNITACNITACNITACNITACMCCRWIAPEVLAGSHYDRAADVYAFGVILWEILTWQVPWDDLGPWQVSAISNCSLTIAHKAAHVGSTFAILVMIYSIGCFCNICHHW